MDRIIMGLANVTAGHPYVRGSIVTQLQSVLVASGFLNGPPDGIFGGNSANAMKKWQASRGLPETGEVTLGAFQQLVGQKPEDFEMCLQLIGHFEGYGFTVANEESDGAMITWGFIGFPFSSGELHTLIGDIDADDPNAVKQAFGDLEPALRQALELPTTGEASAEWLTSITQPGNRGCLVAGWDRAFGKLVFSPVVQRQQIARAKSKFLPAAQRDAARLNLTGLSGAALCLDIAVQCGGVTDGQFDAIQTRMAAAHSALTDQKKREIVANVMGEAAIHTRDIGDLRARLQTLATGDGKVRGGWYSMRNWGLADDPGPGQGDFAVTTFASVAPPPLVLAAGDMTKFNAFISSLGLEFFRADEFAFLGHNNSTPGKPGFGQNYLPGTDIWPNIVRTAQIMDRLRRDLRSSIYLTNVYRSPQYNVAIDGAPGSMHTLFNAVDFYCKDGNPPAFWAAKLSEYRDKGLFAGGIGIYTSKNFVHLDTRGVNKNFGA